MDIQKGIEFRVMKLTELQSAPYNPRDITDEEFERLGGAINEFGFMVLVVWNKRTGNVVGGHQRLRYLKEVGETETIVSVVDLDTQEEMALNVALNNPKIRGKFTSDVIGALKYVEGQSKDAFENSGLDALKESLAYFRFEGESSHRPTGEGDPPENTHKAVVTCPECRERWGLKDKRVINGSVGN